MPERRKRIALLEGPPLLVDGGVELVDTFAERLDRPCREEADNPAPADPQSGDGRLRRVGQVDVVHVGIDAGAELALEAAGTASSPPEAPPSVPSRWWPAGGPASSAHDAKASAAVDWREALVVRLATMGIMLARDPAAFDRAYDVVVIGGGITGVQIAREVACRGHSVLLVEREDFGSGTSSATTKYLHGGIRYLEQGDVRVVRESLRERRILGLGAPHLVQQMPFVLPVWSWSKPGRWALTAGAVAYHLLALDRNRDAPASLRIGRPRWLDRDAALRTVPWLDPDDLRGAVVVTDTLSLHPERLLLALLLDAVEAGAEARNHCPVVGFDLDRVDGRTAVRGVDVVDRTTGTRHRIATGRVVNAAGPWMAEVLGLADPQLGPRVSPSKGVHVLTRPVVDGVTQAVMARARNGRHVVVSPWQGRSFIGPTDTPVSSPPDAVAADARDVDEILTIVNSCRAADQRLGIDDVDDVEVGIRPLVGTEGGDTYTASRRHEIHDHAADGFDGLWSVSGGKWTTGRAIAADVADEVIEPARSPTRSRPVAGSVGWAEPPELLLELAARARPGVDLPPDTREHLGRLFGTRCTDVLDLVEADPALGRPVSDRPACRDILAQVVMAIVDEGALTLADIVDRRLVLGTLGPVSDAELQRVAAVAAPLLGWVDGGAAEVAAESRRRAETRSRWGDRP